MNTIIPSEIPALQQFILLVDDDEDDRFIMNDFFEINGYKSLIMASGKAALQFLHGLSARQYPAAIIIDYNMPIYTGEDILKQIKLDKELSHIPLIIYSSEMTENLSRHLLSLGALHCFTKVYTRQQLDYMQDILDELLSA